MTFRSALHKAAYDEIAPILEKFQVELIDLVAPELQDMAFKDPMVRKLRKDIENLTQAKRDMRAALVKREDKTANKVCPNCAATFNNMTQIVKSEERNALLRARKLLRGMFPRTYEDRK